MPLFVVRCGWLVLAAALVLGAVPVAQADKDSPEIDPKARTVLTAFAKSVEGIDSLRMEGTFKASIGIGDFEVEMVGDVVFRHQTPNKVFEHLVMNAAGETFETVMVSDGKVYRRYDSESNAYVELLSPESLADIEDLEPDDASSAGDFLEDDPFGGAVEHEDPVKWMFDLLTAGRYLGVVELHGRKCHHLEVETTRSKWQAWLSVEESPALVQLAPDMQPFAEQMFADVELPPGTKIEAEAIFGISTWEINAKFDEDAFEWKLPQEAKRVEVLVDDFTPQTDPARMVGRRAPDLTLPTLAGEDFNLADERGQIVVITFWGEWSEKSRRALRVVGEAVAALGDDVVFQTVHVGDDDQAVRAAMTEDKLKLPVALALDAEAVAHWRVGGIPLTYVIDREGKVQAVFAALPPDLGAQVTAAIKKQLDEASAN